MDKLYRGDWLISDIDETVPLAIWQHSQDKTPLTEGLVKTISGKKNVSLRSVLPDSLDFVCTVEVFSDASWLYVRMPKSIVTDSLGIVDWLYDKDGITVGYLGTLDNEQVLITFELEVVTNVNMQLTYFVLNIVRTTEFELAN